MSKRTKHDPDFREGAVRIVVESGKSIALVAGDLGINEGTLSNWVGNAGEFAGGDDAPLSTAGKINNGPPHDGPAYTLTGDGHRPAQVRTDIGRCPSCDVGYWDNLTGA